MMKQFTQWLQSTVSEEGKHRIVANIVEANSYEYRAQVAEHNLVNAVLDDILADPYWRQIAIDALGAQKGA